MPDTFKFYDVVIYAARGSNSARTLATHLGCRRWRDDLPSRYTRRKAFFRGRRGPVVLNWGSTIRPDWGTIRQAVEHSERSGLWLNTQEAVSTALNKTKTFEALSKLEVPCLRFTHSKEEVQKWLTKGHTVFARRTVTGAGGEGITILEPGSQIVDAALYTRNYPKTHEFRVHVFNGKVIDFVEKKAKLNGFPNPGAIDANRHIRNYDNGWVFAHDNLSVDANSKKILEDIAIRAVSGVGLNVGAVDLLSVLSEGTGNREVKSARVCEINTGPGLEAPTTIGAYGRALIEFRNETIKR